jgi:hypothetical protein
MDPDKLTSESRPVWFSWLELLRIPNICSVPGDPLMGMAIALSVGESMHWGPVLMAVSISVLLYFAGMILNDLVDIKEDLADRPDRPLPSGRIKKAAAIVAFFVLVAAALGVASLLGWEMFSVAWVLLLFIALYNLGMKNNRWFGPVNMGLCRSCSVLLGAVALQHKVDDTAPLVTLFLAMNVYIAMVTLIANYETRDSIPRHFAWMPPVVLLAGMIPMYFYYFPERFSTPGIGFILLICWACYRLLGSMREIYLRSKVIPPHIGVMISTLILVQAGVLCLAGQFVTAGVVVLFLPLNRLLVRRFYAS